jgi:Fe-S cluster assembly ATP-binding protein
MRVVETRVRHVSDTPLLQIENLHAAADRVPILKGVDLVVDRGEIHALMGPNGSGKSTLANVLLGHPDYRVTAGRILYEGEDITGAAPDDRARRGMFLAFQYPEEIPGVSVTQFLRQALSNRTGIDYTVLELRLKVMEAMSALGMESSFADRYLNEGFSGGERKRNEVLQMAVLEPVLAVMDETDSGLDIDALRTVAEGVNRLVSDDRGFLIITHYQRLLDYVTPHRVHVFMDGRVLVSGGPELAEKLEAEGYDAFRQTA